VSGELAQLVCLAGYGSAWLAGRPESRVLIKMAGRAWVFGGMGSWNDLGFNDPVARTRYETVSENPYRSVLTAIVAATKAEFDGSS
jgi:hypothetical protein